MGLGVDPNAEWLEPDGLGGYASGTVSGVRSRRYHALLLAATTPPGGRRVLVNGFDAFVTTESGRYALSAQRYSPDVVDPDGATRLRAFTDEPWPHWSYGLDDGTVVEQEIFVPRGSALVALCWRVIGPPKAATLTVRPFLSGRDYHALHHENGAFRFDARFDGDHVVFRPYESVPPIVALANGGYMEEPQWYRNFLYEEELSRGLDHVEDLASPGCFRFDLEKGEAVLLLWAGEPTQADLERKVTAAGLLARLRDEERTRREAFRSRLERAADAYLVCRDTGHTLIAGYPWFLDWGRDTFIALRGLCLATGRLGQAGGILFEWAHAVSQGMLPNRFADDGAKPEFNSVDAALWYVIAVHEYLEAARTTKAQAAATCPTCGRASACLERAVAEILAGYSAGTRHGIRMDADGLLSAGEPGLQLTWMDAKVGDWVVTPRIGKPVEVQALWLNALRIGAGFDGRWNEPFERGLRSFQARFWNPDRDFLYDVLDTDNRPGEADPAVRPNAIFAVGGLPFPLLDGDRARRVVEVVEAKLLTPLGLRSLAPGEPGYAGRYQGGVRERDGSYHQGTVWPWLLGPFVEAWVRVNGGSAAARSQARRRFLEPLWSHLLEAGLGHVSEIADADHPHTPRGCPFQAWSVGEAIRLDRVVLAGGGGSAARPKPKPGRRPTPRETGAPRRAIGA